MICGWLMWNWAASSESLVRSHTNQPGDETRTMDTPLVRFNNLFFSEAPSFAPGELLLDRFRIVRFIGRGGMGEVYEAEDPQLGRIALKTIRTDLAGNPNVLARFRQEVQLARKVTSPNVCRIHDLFLLPALATGVRGCISHYGISRGGYLWRTVSQC